MRHKLQRAEQTLLQLGINMWVTRNKRGENRIGLYVSTFWFKWSSNNASEIGQN